MSTSYGQFCPIAKASEIFATRWTPLIVRELMTGVHSFNDIHRGVPLISRAVLVARLRELEDHGVIERGPRGADGAGHEYWLTPAGDGLRVAMHALGQWGMTYTHDRIKRSDLDPALLIWGLRKRVDLSTLPDRRVVLCFKFSGVPASRTKFRIMWLVLGRSGVDVCMKDPGLPSILHFAGNSVITSKSLSQPGNRAVTELGQPVRVRMRRRPATVRGYGAQSVIEGGPARAAAIANFW